MTSACSIDLERERCTVGDRSAARSAQDGSGRVAAAPLVSDPLRCGGIGLLLIGRGERDSTFERVAGRWAAHVRSDQGVVAGRTRWSSPAGYQAIPSQQRVSAFSMVPWFR
jgi:hypothetical protein